MKKEQDNNWLIVGVLFSVVLSITAIIILILFANILDAHIQSVKRAFDDVPKKVCHNEDYDLGNITLIKNQEGKVVIPQIGNAIINCDKSLIAHLTINKSWIGSGFTGNSITCTYTATKEVCEIK